MRTKTTTKVPVPPPLWWSVTPVRLIDWVSEVRQIPVKEERRVLWYASDE